MIQNSGSSSTEEGFAAHTAVDDLILVSNRQPYRHRYGGEEGEDRVTVDSPVGGLTAGLDPVMRRLEGTWVAWGDGEADYDVVDDDDCVTVPPSDPAYTLQRLRLSDEQIQGYYDGYANQALWPLCHSDTCRVNFNRDHWNHYKSVNEQFADAVVDHADDGSTIWFQDYHFTLAPRRVKAKVPNAFLMHFFHIPWPAEDVFRVCPQRKALLDGLLGNDLLGFHVPRYCARFLECVEAHLDGATVDWSSGEVHYEDHVTRVHAFPLGVDADEIRRISASADGTFWARFRHVHDIDEETAVGIGVDRLDYTKGIPNRLEMLEHLFETRPELRGEFTYVQKASETRERIPAYQQLRDQVEEKVEQLNERFATDDWQPVIYTTEMFDRDELIELYRYSDIALVSPLRDGMNLVAKEYVASQVDDEGALLLSQMTGAYEQLEEGTLELDPYDTSAGADAIEQALEMDDWERRSRMRKLRRSVHENDLTDWLGDVLDTASTVQKGRPQQH